MDRCTGHCDVTDILLLQLSVGACRQSICLLRIFTEESACKQALADLHMMLSLKLFLMLTTQEAFMDSAYHDLIYTIHISICNFSH